MSSDWSSQLGVICVLVLKRTGPLAPSFFVTPVPIPADIPRPERRASTHPFFLIHVAHASYLVLSRGPSHRLQAQWRRSVILDILIIKRILNYMKEVNRQEVTRVFRALAVEKRLEIVRLLAEQTLCVGALSTLLNISAGAVSQHLRILRDAGIVEPDRRGYFIHYSLAPGASGRCRELVESLFGKKAGSRKEGRICAMKRRSVKSRTN